MDGEGTKILVLLNFNCKPDGPLELIMLKHAVARSLDYSIPGIDQDVRDGAHRKWCAGSLFVNPEYEAKIKVPHRKTGKNQDLLVKCDAIIGSEAAQARRAHSHNNHRSHHSSLDFANQ